MPKTLGKDWDLRIEVASTQTVIGGQRGCSLAVERAEINTTTKDDGAWETALPGFGRWSIECEGLIVHDDAAYAQMVTNILADSPPALVAEILRPDGKVFRGNVYLMSLNSELPHEDAANQSFTFRGSGAPSKKWEDP